MEKDIVANVYTFDSLLPGEHFICVDDLTSNKGIQEYRVGSQKVVEIFRHSILGDCPQAQGDFPPKKLVLRIRS